MEEKHNIRPGRPKNNSSGSGDKFSFPIFPLVEEEDNDHDSGGGGGGFEFGGCATDYSDSPNSPADHLFFNGRLLPHAFPCQPPTTTVNTFSSFSRSTSVTSSVSSKDYSFVSSRSNSRSSSCSSARTSISTTESAILSERKVLITHHPKVSSSTYRRSVTRLSSSSSSSPHYGTSRRWQFLITPAAPPPAALILKKKKKKKQQHHQLQQEGKGGSRWRKAVENGEREEFKCKKKANKKWFWWRFFRSFVSACKECHAISPSPRNYPPN